MKKTNVETPGSDYGPEGFTGDGTEKLIENAGALDPTDPSSFEQKKSHRPGKVLENLSSED